MFSTKTSEVEVLCKIRNFIQFPKVEMFRKRTGNGVSTENVQRVQKAHFLSV